MVLFTYFFFLFGTKPETFFFTMHTCMYMVNTLTQDDRFTGPNSAFQGLILFFGSFTLFLAVS